MPPQRALCIVADDFGMHDGGCAATLRLLAMGRVQAVGCMVGGTAWRDWHALLARSDAQAVDLGLHLDLSDHPLRSRAWRRLPALWSACWLRRLDVAGLRAELCAQLDAFEDAIGRRPAFVDGHQHVHQLPQVRELLLAELGRRYGAQRPWLRCTRRPARPLPSRFKASLIGALGRVELMAQAERQGFAHNEHLLGVYDFDATTGAYAQHLARWLAACGPADLLMCHPSLSRGDLVSHADARRAEYEALASSDFGRLLAREDVRLQAMSRTLSQRRSATA